MVYVFVFLGEFGFELFNWQGTIRKFSHTISVNDQIVCCSRANLYPLYETAEAFIDISMVETFQRSKARAYYADLPVEMNGWTPAKNLMFNQSVKTDLEMFIRAQLNALPEFTSREHGAYQFIFSSDGQELNGCRFGWPLATASPIGLFGANLGYTIRKLRHHLPFYQAQIENIKMASRAVIKQFHKTAYSEVYAELNLQNNIYQKIEVDLTFKDTIEQKLGWSLDEPFILCQSRTRDDQMQPTTDRLPQRELDLLIQSLSQQCKVILLSFETGRLLDSYSQFSTFDDCFPYRCISFPEQACLIHFAQHCIFFTEGDFGSHIYIPPFLGRDVTAVAPESIYRLDTAPIDFWNKHVFQFGGQIKPQIAETVLISKSQREALIDNILGQAQ